MRVVQHTSLRKQEHWLHIGARVSRTQARVYALAAGQSRRVRWWFHFGTERGPIKGAPESGMPPPEQESHRPKAQDTPADCCCPGQPLTGQIGQHDEVPEEEKEPDHQTKPDAHPK